MKKNVIKTVIAAVCVVAAGMGGMKAYNAANQSEADMLLSENVEALSAGDDYCRWCGYAACYGGSSWCSAFNGDGKFYVPCPGRN